MRIPHCELPDHSISTEHFLPRGDSSQPDASGSPTADRRGIDRLPVLLA